LLLACGLGSGLSPVAPGTLGSVPGLLLAWYLAGISSAVLYLAAALSVIVGVPLCGAAARRLQAHDHPGIVWDEIAGMLITTSLWIPDSWIGWLAAFAAFRLFDIAKPWPISWLDKKIPGGVGIMADDIAAAGFAAILLALLARISIA